MTSCEKKRTSVASEKQLPEGVTTIEEVEKLQESLNVSPEDDRRVRRKADWLLLPLLMTIYGIQFKLPIAKMTGANIVLWGAVLCFMAVCTNFSQLMAVRFLLGFFESSIAPGLMIFTVQWYRAGEQGHRTGLWTACNSLGGIFGGAIAYGFAGADQRGALSIHGWKIIFIFLGTLTAFLGMVFLVVVPDSPDKAWFLSEREKLIARERLLSNHQRIEEREFRWHQVWEALKDPLIWLYMLGSGLTSIPNGGFTNFFAILIEGFGFTAKQTLLLGMANSWLAICIIVSMYLGDKVKNRTAMAFVPLAISTAGVAMIWGINPKNRIARLMGFYLVFPYAVPNIIILAHVVTNVAGRTKKMFVNALFMCFYCAGNLVGPQTFRQKDAPSFTPALITVIVCNVLVGFIMIAIWAIYKRENRRRDQLELEQGVSSLNTLDKDLTDRENPSFRYTI
ncbi:hypothetical protein CspeluHIS016_0211980 [Cutaneotrichosporon spelunceum]|uniref:MFS general substrate transporter n=1 Tax=Cutaneotrichosporon spelunceum TaxID=1672016 RepID=A0AAD3TTB4_9TREE|nr:hypothetical protein CspeluHIS016_0211980 [Cutaneotrichosporon spelunceum]